MATKKDGGGDKPEELDDSAPSGKDGGEGEPDGTIEELDDSAPDPGATLNPPPHAASRKTVAPEDASHDSNFNAAVAEEVKKALAAEREKEPPIQGIERGLTIVQRSAARHKKILTRDLATFPFCKTAAKIPEPPFDSCRADGYNQWLLFFAELLLQWSPIQMVEEARRIRVGIVNKKVPDPGVEEAANDAKRLAVIFLALQQRYGTAFDELCATNKLDKQFDVRKLLQFGSSAMTPEDEDEDEDDEGEGESESGKA